MRRILAIAFIAAGLIALPLAFADDQSGSDQGSGDSSGQMSGSSYGDSGRYGQSGSDQSGSTFGQEKSPKDISGRSISDEAEKEASEQMDRELRGHGIAEEGRQGGFGSTTTRPSRESTDMSDTERDMSARERTHRESGARGETRTYSMQELKNLSPDARFLVSNYQCNLFEIEAARLVADRTQNNEIRRFARRLHDDHRQANQRISRLADRKNVALPKGLLSFQRDILDFMSQMNDDELGRQFVFHSVGSHNTSILQHQYAANHSRDRDVRQLAEQMTTDLESHLQVACGMATNLTEGREGQARIDNR